jgi:cell division septal protein FtsQ
MGTPAATAAGRRRTGAGSPRASARARRPAAQHRDTRAPRVRRAMRQLRGSWRLWLAATAIMAGALAIAYFAWFRHSSLVAVREVKVEGVRSADRDEITAALAKAAAGMTTLDVDATKLASAVRGFPAVASVSADATFPHELTVHVFERRPVLLASDGDRQVAVAADGSLLPGASTDATKLPTLHFDQLPQEGPLGGQALEVVRAVAAAPGPLRPLIESAASTADDGIVVALRGGIDLRFGTASRASAKWAAAAAVLADPDVTSLEYVDVQVPARPAIGG